MAAKLGVVWKNSNNRKGRLAIVDTERDLTGWKVKDWSPAGSFKVTVVNP